MALSKLPGQRVGSLYARLLSEKALTPYLKKMTREYLRLEPANMPCLPNAKSTMQRTLYLHIPFCESLCPYCSFNKFIFDEEKARQYHHSLRKEMRMAKSLGFNFNSLYIGGGTPTILIDELVKTIDLANELFSLDEVSCETNPNHLLPEYIDRLKGRIHRLSVGVQSFNDELLKQMARFQKFGPGRVILDRIQKVAPSFPSVNVDMIYNFPNQTEEILRQDLHAILDSGAQQTTFYPLMTSDSISHSMECSVGRVDYQREAQFYEIILNELAGQFYPMTAWTFHRQGTGMIDEYIVESDEYVGLGAGAFSFLDGILYVNTFSTRQYSQLIEAGSMSVSMKQMYGKRERMRYRFMMELFSLRFDRERFTHLFRLPVEYGLPVEMMFMFLAGAFSKVDPDAYYLTPRGKYLSVVLMREFFSGVNNVRDEARKALSEEEHMCAYPLQAKQLAVPGD